MVPRLIQYEYTRPGKNVVVYNHWLIHDSAEMLVLFMPVYEGEDIRFGGRLAIEHGGSMVWCLFPEKWYDIGSFFLSDGTHTGWYTNFCTPVQTRGDIWLSTDLFLDHWTSTSGASFWLDEEEYSDAVRADLISREAQYQVEKGREEINRQLAVEWPPQSVQRIDLIEATGLLGDTTNF